MASVEIWVEAVALADEAVWLVPSEDGGWTLPGGPLAYGEGPVEGLRRHLRALAGVEVKEPVILEAASRSEEGRWRMILRYACRLTREPRPVGALFHIEHLPSLEPGQRAAIYRALQVL